MYIPPYTYGPKMMRLEKAHIVFLIVFFLLTVAGLYNLSRRPGLPFSSRLLPAGLQIESTGSGSKMDSIRGKIVSRIDGYAVTTIPEIETLIERKRIGDTVRLELAGGEPLQVVLIPRHDLWYILVNAISGLFFFLIAGIVRQHARTPGESHFAVSALLFGYIIAVSWAGIALPVAISLPLVLVYFLSYPQAFLQFLLFCYDFPTRRHSAALPRFRKRILHAVGFAFSLVLFALFLRKTFSTDLSHTQQYAAFYRIFRAFIFLTVVIALYVLIRNEQRDRTPVSRRQVLWILGSIVWGGFPFIFLWNLPQVLGFSPFIPEWLVNVFLLIIPTSIAIAIVRYRLFDIEIFLSRSITYAVVITALSGLYILIVGGGSFFLYEQFSIRSPVLSFFAALGMALLLNPLKSRVQCFVDRNFFRIRYDRFRSLESFMAALEACSGEAAVFETLHRFFAASIPVEHSVFAVADQEKWKIYDFSGKTPRGFEKKLPAAIAQEWSGYAVNALHRSRFEEAGAEVVQSLPDSCLLAVRIGERALWCLGEKRSGMRYWREDVELACQMAKAAALQVEKLKYIRMALRESLEKEQAQKMSRWKSLLVAEVAHDLRAPLNTMLWKLRNLQHDLQRNAAVPGHPMLEIERYLTRLQRFVQSLLILSRTEKGRYPVQRQIVPVHQMITEMIENLQGMVESKELRLCVKCPGALQLRTDPVLFQEIVLNLLHNAVKFSPPRAEIAVEAAVAVRRRKEKLRLAIRDQAGGIPAEKRASLFEPFAASASGPAAVQGFHLGLYIVREFTRLLKGEIRYHTRPGKGTEFTLYFPDVIQPQTGPRDIAASVRTKRA